MYNFFHDNNAKNYVKYNNFFERIFSVKYLFSNEYRYRCYKILTILGLKFLFYDFKNYKTLKSNYKKVINRLKKCDKIKIVFVVDEILKWKTQSLYDLMSKSNLYEPLIVLVIADYQFNLPKEEKEKILQKNYQYFNDIGVNCLYAYNIDKDEPIDLKEFNPDIVFFQQPFVLKQNLQPLKVSEYALTCYVPYYVPCYGLLDIDCNEFHSLLFKYYVLNNDWEKLYKTFMKPVNYNICAVGHTVFDEIIQKKDNINDEKQYVIYAPHCAINHPEIRKNENYSTFLYNGITILNYAKEHSELNWVFRPHPELKMVLKTVGWPTKMIDDYYSEWEKLGIYSQDDNFIDLSLMSKVLITDCDFLLMEYYSTGKPIIHLISPDCRICPSVASLKIFKSFYSVHNKYDLFKYFDDVIVKGNDRKLKEREKNLYLYNMANNNAANNIIKDLTTTIKGKDFKI